MDVVSMIIHLYSISASSKACIGLIYTIRVIAISPCHSLHVYLFKTWSFSSSIKGGITRNETLPKHGDERRYTKA